MTLNKDDFDGRMDWFYPHQIDVKLTQGMKLGELAIITAKSGVGKSIFDTMTPAERKQCKILLNKEFGK